MMKLSLKFASLFVAAATVMFAQSTPAANAVDPAAMLAQAKLDFAQRGQTRNVDKVINALEDAALETNDARLLYEIYILESWAYQFKGEFLTPDKTEADKKVQINLFLKGMTLAKKAMVQQPQFGEAPYWYAVNLARWGVANGVANSLAKTGELKDHLNLALAKTTMSGASMQTYDGDGPDRVYGRMFFKLGIFGGDKHNEKSLEFLETSLAHGATYAENTTYIAETLMALGNGLMGMGGNPAYLERARKLLTEMLAKADATGVPTINPERLLESTKSYAEARALLNNLRR